MVRDIGQASDPLPLASNISTFVDWPVFDSAEAGDLQLPDQMLYVKGTAGIKDSRDMSGEVQEHHGFQVTVRSNDAKTVYKKAKAIANALDHALDGMFNRTVVVSDPDGDTNVQYVVYNVSRTSGVLAIGKGSPNSGMSYATFNGTVALRQAN